MKKLSFVIIAFAGLLLQTACNEDESSLAVNDVGDIVIGKFDDQSVISYSGNLLEITPQVTSGYPDDQLSYAWYMYPNSGNGFFDGGYRNLLISRDRNLRYEVNLPSGQYFFVLEVTAPNGYSVTRKMSLSASTNFSTGFYVLKETADGNTDIDCQNDSILSTDLITRATGAPLAGKPKNLSVAYDHGGIDTVTNRMITCNLVNVISESNHFMSFRTEDMQQIFDNTNILFGSTIHDEEVYLMSRLCYHTFILTSAGLRTSYIGSVMVDEEGQPNSSGRYGNPVGVGGSAFAHPLASRRMMYYGGMVYWNNTEHGISKTDMYGMSVVPVNFTIPGVDNSNLQCIASGSNSINSLIYFVVEDTTTRLRYLVKVTYAGKAEGVVALDPSLHIARSTVIAENAKTAAVFYCVDDNHLYAYNLNTGVEAELQLPGLTGGETITYVGNVYWNKMTDNPVNPFDYLVVGCQDGDHYRAYMYKDLVGGQPNNDPFQVISGQGRLKRVCYVASGEIGGGILYTQFPALFPM